MSLENLKKDNVNEKLKELLEKDLVYAIMLKEKETGKDVPAFVVNDKIWVNPSMEEPNGLFIFPGNVLYLEEDSYKIVPISNLEQYFSHYDVRPEFVNPLVCELLDLPENSNVVNGYFVKTIIEENHIEEYVKSMDNYERVQVVEKDKQKEKILPAPPSQNKIYPKNNLRRPLEKARHNESFSNESVPQYSTYSQPINREETFKEPEIDTELVSATAVIIADRLYDDGQDFITVEQLQNISDNARYLDEDQKAAAQYLADRFSEANLDNLSLDQLRDYADNAEVLGGRAYEDISVETNNEYHDEKSLFDEINNTEYSPIMPSELNYGDKYDRERVRDNDND